VRGRQSLSSNGGRINKSFAEIASGASINVLPADAVINATFRSVAYGILRALDASPSRPIILGHIVGLVNETVQVEITCMRMMESTIDTFCFILPLHSAEPCWQVICPLELRLAFPYGKGVKSIMSRSPPVMALLSVPVL
jgi:hypothetical protein